MKLLNKLKIIILSLISMTLHYDTNNKIISYNDKIRSNLCSKKVYFITTVVI